MIPHIRQINSLLCSTEAELQCPTYCIGAAPCHFVAGGYIEAHFICCSYLQKSLFLCLKSLGCPYSSAWRKEQAFWHLYIFVRVKWSSKSIQRFSQKTAISLFLYMGFDFAVRETASATTEERCSDKYGPLCLKCDSAGSGTWVTLKAEWTALKQL